MDKHATIFVAGHRGMAGSAIIRALRKAGYTHILTASHTEVDLIDQAAVRAYFKIHRPSYVFLAAAQVGGIHANNTLPAEFIYQNLMIEANVIESAWQNGVKRLIFLGSSCSYPCLAPQPMVEETLLTGLLEPTNEPYAVAKIAGIKMCESFNRQYGTDFRSVMPTNLYGPGDNFDLTNSHVIPALLRKFHEAKINKAESVEIWGSGSPRREFLHVDDMASDCLFVMNLEPSIYQAHTRPMLSHLNVGTGKDLTIRELAETIKQVVNFNGVLIFNSDKPDGAPQKLLDISRLHAMGWHSAIGLKKGLQDTYQWYKANIASARL
ncbi:GDP-L-fucose synthase family protein [Desulfobacter sp.]|uniref:GDP-L-fucose synthase family protein n=1 Tax=Desulfobacter sp. TaxID=2294 RepID=UPI003D0E7584